MKILKKLVVSLLTVILCMSLISIDAFAASRAVPNKTYSMYLQGGETARYSFTLNRAQKVVFTLTTSGTYCNYNRFYLYDANGNEIRWEYIEENNTVGKKVCKYTDYLAKGNYTVTFDGGWGNEGRLQWSYSAKNISRITQRSHAIYSRAPTCGFRKYYFDYFGSGNYKNIVKFNVPATGTYQMCITSTVDWGMNYKVYNANGDEVYSHSYIRVNQSVGKVSVKDNMSLRKGLYYVVFDSWDSRGIYKWMMRRIR